MNKKADAAKGDDFNFLTDYLLAADYLFHATSKTSGKDRDQVSVGRFYDDWSATWKLSRPVALFNPGTVIGALFLGIVIPSENWLDLVPDELIGTSDPEWGLRKAKILAPTNPSPNIRYAIRRMRNALSHSRFVVAMPKDVVPDVLAGTTIAFHDVNDRNPADTFDMTLTMEDSIRLIGKFREVVYPQVTERVAEPGP